jgi:PAS domain S-box-containing protein
MGKDSANFAGQNTSFDDERILSRIVYSACDGILLFDLYGRILYANPAASALCRQPASQLRGMHIEQVLDLGNAGEILRMLRQNQIVQTETELRVGQEGRRHVLASLFPLHDSDAAPPSAAAAIIRDISSQRQAYAETQRQLNELRLLNRVNTAVSSSLELEKVLSILLEETRETLGVEACSAALLDEEQQDLFFIMAEGVGANRVRGARMPASQGVIGWVVRNRQPLIVPDVSQDPRFFPGIDNITGERTRSLMCVPLEAHGKVIGAIEAMNKREGSFDKDDLRLFTLIAASAATAISNALLFHRQKELADALERRHQELMVELRQKSGTEQREVLRRLEEDMAKAISLPLTVIVHQSESWLRREDLPQELVDDLANIRAEAYRLRTFLSRLMEEGAGQENTGSSGER